MSRYLLIRRLRGPAFLLLLGVIALLHQTGVVYHFWHLFWPLALILWGVMLLAERAALEMEGEPPMYGETTDPAGYPQAPVAGAGTAPSPTATSTSIVPSDTNDLDRINGGRS